LKEIGSVDTYYIAAALVKHGSGVAVVDEFTAMAMKTDGLDVFPITPAVTFTVQAAWLEDRPLSKLAERLIQVMKNILDRQSNL
jgi:DNA-binding transcriptional LysR family regulator